MTLSVVALLGDGSSTLVPEDPTDGWELTDASRTAVVFNGASCANQKDGGYTQLSFAYLCQVSTDLGIDRSARSGESAPNGR